MPIFTLMMPSIDHCRNEIVLPPSDHYALIVDTVAPSGDHYCIETVPPSSDNYGTTEIPQPSDHLHTKRT